MSHRLDVELTSNRDDGTWTWRAAGAKKPKGSLDASLLYEGAEVGDVCRVEAETYVDGTEIVAVLPPKTKVRKEPELLEILGSGRNTELVTTQLAPKGRGRGDRKGGGRGRGDRDGRGGAKGRGDRKGGGRGGRDSRDGRGDRKGRGRNDRKGGGRNERSNAPSRPKPKRLRPKRTHRDAAIKALPEIQQALGREVLRDGIPGVRAIAEKQITAATAAGTPKIRTDALLALAEKILPTLKAAEWRDRAEAAKAGVDDVDLRDLRSVVAAGSTQAKGSEAKALATELSEAVTARVDAEHRKWLQELSETLAEGRTVRALRLSSRPPKAGAPIPSEIAQKLTEQSNESLTSDTGSDRFATVLDAVAFSPVHTQVRPASIPANPGDDLLAAVKRLSMRIPDIAKMFGIEPTPPPKRSRSGGQRRR